MNQNNVLQITKEGIVSTKDGRKFTRIIGGFGEDKPIITVKQIAELMEYDVKVINQTINRNIGAFTKEEGYIKDLKEVTESDHNLEVLKSLGYSNMAISKSKNIYVLSEAGFLLYLKFAEGDRAVEIYKDFIEDYFKTKAENIVLEKTLQEELDFLKEQKKFLLGSMFMETDENKKMEFFNQNENMNSRIQEIEITLSKEQLVEQLKPQLSIAEKFTHAEVNYDMNAFSKVLNIDGLGRNNLFKWLRDQEILMKSNQPYQRHMDYFEVLPLENKYTNRIDYKTMVKPKGVEYIVKRLIKDGKIITKSVIEILKELDTINTLEKTA